MSKTIQINPALFNVSGSLTKTKKNREKKTKPIISTLITPNALKNKLLKRIKEHKKNEITQDGGDDKKNTITDIGAYTDEFNDSMDYLKSLSNLKKTDENVYNKTIKHQKKGAHVPEVHLGLPETLQIDTIVQPQIIEQPILLSNKPKPNPKTFDDPPWGCLKGGHKKTYREWNRTVKNHAPIVLPKKTNEETEREQRLNMLRDKIKLKQKEKEQDNIIINTNLIQNKPVTDTSIKINDSFPQISETPMQELEVSPENAALIQQYKEEDKELSNRRLIKRTIRRQYTIGKSKIKNQVGILIKDRNTRKNILSAQLDLRKKPLNEIKTYLRNHALIKVGSNAPNDVIRKIYESSMLSGEITNNNQETLLHNFLKDKDAE
jgi:hypothetical protein